MISDRRLKFLVQWSNVRKGFCSTSVVILTHPGHSYPRGWWIRNNWTWTERNWTTTESSQFLIQRPRDLQYVCYHYIYKKWLKEREWCSYYSRIRTGTLLNCWILLSQNVDCWSKPTVDNVSHTGFTLLGTRSGNLRGRNLQAGNGKFSQRFGSCNHTVVGNTSLIVILTRNKPFQWYGCNCQVHPSQTIFQGHRHCIHGLQGDCDRCKDRLVYLIRSAARTLSSNVTAPWRYYTWNSDAATSRLYTCSCCNPKDWAPCAEHRDSRGRRWDVCVCYII